MIQNNIYGNRAAARRLAVGCLLLFAFFGSAMAQSGRFVIKKKFQEGDGTTVHYLAHVKDGEGVWVLQDATAFNPETCLWISDNTYTQGGTNKNYYFYDDAMPTPNPRFLGAPSFTAGGALTISTAVPPTSYLNNPEHQYYFYKWDNGLGRGIQFHGVTQAWCNNPDPENHPDVHHGWNNSNECWEVYWVSYHEGTWKLSEEQYDLDDVPYGGKYHAVSITEHVTDTATLSGGLADLTDFDLDFNESVQVTPSIASYQYSVTQAYTTYVFDGGTHNYWGGSDQAGNTPGAVPSASGLTPSSYKWTITGDGASYLTIDDNTLSAPTITYSTSNDDGHKTATLTLKVTYNDGSKQTSSATILVKTPCQNPSSVSAAPNTMGATLSWTHTAESYLVSWRELGAPSWNSVSVGNVTSYTITGLVYGGITYEYKVKATSCSTSEPSTSTFTTVADPGLLVSGAIFGGGRMANVGGKTEVVIINCGDIEAVYGGNDIAGSVAGEDGSKITIGVNAGDPDGYATYGTTSAAINIGSVYGGGNGYYAYNGNSFVAASSEYTQETVAIGASVKAMTQNHTVGDVAWTNNTSEDKVLKFPSIVKTAIKVTNDFVKIDSIFGGAKNAFLTTNSGNGSSITIDDGIVYAVFGGNNFGGTQGYGKHYIEVNGTHTNLAANITNTTTTGYGRDFGIRYLFGGGNKVEGSTTDIHIKGGQLDEVFAGGNAADVYKANVEVECSLGADAGDPHLTFGNTYTNAIDYTHYNGSTIDESTLLGTYEWDGKSGIYNVRTLYGGNNEAEMTRLPVVTLTSGSVGTVYGGGNAGDMMGVATDNGSGGLLSINGNNVVYGTHVVLNSNKMIVDYIYGGCRMSNVANSTWVELKKGHVGHVYGGCNISGDVGSTRVYDTYAGGSTYPTTLEEQRVKGATYVQAGAGGANTDLIVYKNLFAGSNGYYNCSTDEITYNDDTYFDDPTGQYEGLTIPTHNETNVIVTNGVTVKGNVYAGGNLAFVGFDDDKGFYRGFPELIGLASVRMDGGIVEKNVYGGGNMASIFGINEVRVSGGRIGLALYGGNDRAGQVAEKTKRILPADYTIASDNATSLTDLGVKTYVGVSGNAQIGTVYGGGNGAYPPGSIHYCYDDDEPTQSNTFVDIHIDGRAIGSGGGHIGTVYGGGNGVIVWGDCVTVFLNVDNPVYDRNHVDTIFGGNNMGNLDVVSDIILLHGQVGTVYGGCNQGAMVADGINTETIGNYDDIGSYVRLMDKYVVVTNNATNPPTTHEETVTAKVTEAVYGGCRMNGVTNNSLVLVEGGDFTDVLLFGGSDISGTVSGKSLVAVTGGTVGNVYGGGNGYYTYSGGTVSTIGPSPVVVATGVSTPPICVNSGADILAGTVGASGDGNKRSVFGGGYGAGTSTTGNVEVNIGVVNAANVAATPTIYGAVYGGSALGSVNTSASNTTTVNFLNGTLHGYVFGGGLGDAEDANKGKTFGQVLVNISNETQDAANCFIDLRDASVYGCNNTNGSPQDNVTVHVWQTAYTFAGSSTDYSAATGAHPNYAIQNVFGGGKLAPYQPTASTKRALVYVHGCGNTIRRVFGGGDAAAARHAAVTIEGGRFDQVFGGGNGESNAADVGDGGIDLTVSGGKIRQLFGGNNTSGDISGPMTVSVTNSGTCTECPEDITEFFGGSNQAPMGTSTPVNLTTTIGCDPSHPVAITNVYGGSNLATITGNVTVTIEGGTFTNVYAGSKGDSGTSATITGNTTLNLYGGTITDAAFGGSNVNGNITGQILVNVLDYEACPLNVANIYGASNQTAYTPTNPSLVSPIVNVMHVKQDAGITGSVYGGGNQGAVTANPKVNIGYDATTIVYGETTMAQLIPANYPETSALTNFPRAFVTGDVFGGGNNAAVTGGTTVNMRHANSRANNVFGGGNLTGATTTSVNVMDGTVVTSVYGGCNTNGTISGNIEVNIIGGNLGSDVLSMSSGIFGGGYGSSTRTTGDVTLNIGDGTHAPTIYADVYGGSALGWVNNNTDNTTTVNFAKGTLHGNLYGGGLGQAPDISAEVKGNVVVNIGKDKNGVTVSGGVIDGFVFGANNVKGAPSGTVTVNVCEGTTKNVVGGGNVAAYSHPDGNYPYVHITGGTVTHKVVGGGNEADITGSPLVSIEGGNLCTSTETAVGIYGGCNTSGTVTGNVTLNITGGTIGSQAAVEAKQQAINVHGGGYGSGTKVTGDVTVNFGVDSDTHNDYPKLFGDLYGGSALGDVNTNSSNTTTVNVYNGTIVAVPYQVQDPSHVWVTYYYSGNVFGGGLGDKASLGTGHADVQAKVYGKVHVNIGKSIAPVTPATEPTFSGQAILANCDVFGCNNLNGSPQDEVYVDVYKTFRRASDEVNAVGDVTYAIREVFGGGNQANYDPSNTTSRTNVYIHGCDNTSEFVYGGSNAADAYGVRIVIEGGRFMEAYGGGNGLVVPANIGTGGIGHNFHSGHYSFTVVGSNKHGTNSGGVYEAPLLPEGQCVTSCGAVVNDSHFFGANEAEIYSDLDNVITCEEAASYHYKNVYAGSRWAIIYGDVKLRVCGGQIENLYGGSQGYSQFSADIRKFPTIEQLQADDELPVAQRKYSAALRTHMGYPGSVNTDLIGHGGNVTLIVNGGTIGNVFGGSNINGNIEGKITVIVEDAGSSTCGLNVGDIYGASNSAGYVPTGDDGTDSPKVEIVRGTLGMEFDFNGNSTIEDGERFKGNVFGGGNRGHITSDPKVIIGDGSTGSTATPVTVGGSVHGGGDNGNVTGNPSVIVVPKRHQLTVTAPASIHAVRVTNTLGGSVANTDVGEDMVFNIEAIASVYGYRFDGWTLSPSGTGSSIANTSKASTTFTMGTENTTITATFVGGVPCHTLATEIQPGSSYGSFTVKDGQDHTLTSNQIGEGAVLYLEATPNTGYKFMQWNISGTGSSVSNINTATTTFTMGTDNATITAVFEPVP